MNPPTIPRAVPAPDSFLRTGWDWHRPLMATAVLCAVILAGAVVGLAVDDRTLVGQPIWLKPAKFALSIAVYNVTLAWLLSMLVRWRRTGWWLGTIVSVMVLGELAAIGLQAWRGELSHFNYATAFDAVVYNAMAAMIVTAWAANLGIGAILLVQRVGERSTTWAVRIGTAIALAGMAAAFFMTVPSDEQMVALEGGGPDDVIGAHTVGMADGGPGLPVVGWSTVAGDLRVAHFVGIHGLQTLILLALVLVVLGRRYPRLEPDALRWRVVVVAGSAHAALLVLTAWQALRGQSVVRPDSATLTAAGLLAVATAAGLWWALRGRGGEGGGE
ncbi:hypothetical protein Q8791_17575 [Nocardiopsis sp. CT-R113]|uniref:Uncharacterized protein n=1 Tax=Nocardiopsis codii TaxID=3065942 RepID=A0ABU7K9W4_9ACTN|nr:hypothetical protein [Nocardiopsis sp. CT-R113]MEE2039028.1 hypothetical protein [Nocardiopsis sp. CT-R113]